MMSNYKDLGVLHLDGAAQCDEQVSEKASGVSTVWNIINGNATGKNAIDAEILHQLQTNVTPIPSSQKRFFFVDRSGGKNTIYLDPSMFRDLSPSLQGKDISDLHAVYKQILSPQFLPMTDLVLLNEEQWDDSTEKEMAFKRVVSSASAALDKMLSNRNRFLFLDETRSKSRSFPTFNNVDTQFKCKNSSNMKGTASSETSYSSLVDNSDFYDSDDLDLLLNSDDEASSEEKLVSMDDELSTGQSPACEMMTMECESLQRPADVCHSEKFDPKNDGDLEYTDEESIVVSAGNMIRPLSPYKQAKVLNVLSGAASESNDFPLSEQVNSSSSQYSDLSGIDPCLSTGVASSSAEKRKHSVKESFLHPESAKKPRSCLSMQKLQLIQGVIPGVEDHLGNAAVIDEAIPL